LIKFGPNTYEINTHYVMLMKFVKIVYWSRYRNMVFIFSSYFQRHWILF